YPDLEGVRNRKTARKRYIESCLDRILDADDPDAPGVYIRPEPPMDLMLAYNMGHELYQDLRTKSGVSERVMVRVLEFAMEAKAMADKAAPPPPPGPPPMPPGPDAGPPPEGMMP
ncbi:MAG: hypothetical protein KBC95_05150, partial [Candidatus Peribacteraceae bacterium]|nr:hypothetical protein [Candidatus Peribacteraceae bacterium]